jgi:hypothetical protein
MVYLCKGKQQVLLPNIFDNHISKSCRQEYERVTSKELKKNNMESKALSLEITDNAFLRQYECQFAGDFAKVEYSQQERKIFLTKLILPENLEDNIEFTECFLRAIFVNIKDDKNLKVVPTHPKIAGFVRKHRNEYKEMLPVGISI